MRIKLDENIPHRLAGYGYGNLPPQTLLVVGFDTVLLANFQDCTFIAQIVTPFNIQNDETIDHRAIYVCLN